MSEDTRPPFDISKCQRDKNGHLLCKTRDEHKVRILAADCAGIFPIAAQIEFENECYELHSYSADGRRSSAPMGSTNLDLVNVPVKIEGWINLFQSEHYVALPSSAVYRTKEEADAADNLHRRIACLWIEKKL